MRIIPAIDLLDGACVRLRQGDFGATTRYPKTPLEMAQAFEDAGIGSLHLVDLDGARAGRVVNLAVLEQLATRTRLRIDFGGGIKTGADLQSVFDSGAAQATIGSVAVQQPALFADWLAQYGPEKLVLGADCRDRRIAASGWLEDSGLDVLDYIRRQAAGGVWHVACTDIGRDGMLSGPSVALYEEILAAADVRLIASGGVRSVADLQDLSRIGCEGAIVGKALYEGAITLQQLKSLC